MATCCILAITWVPSLGYAQLLAANSCNELVKHGPGFIKRLEEKLRDLKVRPYEGANSDQTSTGAEYDAG